MKKFIIGLMVAFSTSAFAAPFTIGVIADCQYCDADTAGARQYRNSPAKLQACVEDLNTKDLEFTVHLGDFIDKDWESFDVVGPILAKLKHPSHHVLGNHDYSVADDKKKHVHTKMGLKTRYYDFTVKGWRFVALDGNDVSFHGYPKGSALYQAAEKYYVDNNIESPKWNGAVGKGQMKWLEHVLADATKKGQSVVLMAHFPIYPENTHNLWNAEEIVALIDANDCVKAYFNGHNHAGNYGEKNGVHYITFKGMVDTAESAYSTVEVTDTELRITGYGRQDDKTLTIRKSGE